MQFVRSLRPSKLMWLDHQMAWHLATRQTYLSLIPAPPHPTRSSVNFFSFMVIKLVLAQIQFVAVLIVASVVLLPFITGAALLLWWDELLLVRTRIHKRSENKSCFPFRICL